MLQCQHLLTNRQGLAAGVPPLFGFVWDLCWWCHLALMWRIAGKLRWGVRRTAIQPSAKSDVPPPATPASQQGSSTTSPLFFRAGLRATGAALPSALSPAPSHSPVPALSPYGPRAGTPHSRLSDTAGLATVLAGIRSEFQTSTLLVAFAQCSLHLCPRQQSQ